MWGYNSSLAQISISLELDMKTPITWYVIEKNFLKITIGKMRNFYYALNSYGYFKDRDRNNWEIPSK